MHKGRSIFGSSDKCVPRSLNSEDFQFEIFFIAEAVRLTF